MVVLFFVDTYEYNPIQYLISIRGYLASGGALLVVVLFFVDTYEYNPIQYLIPIQGVPC